MSIYKKLALLIFCISATMFAGAQPYKPVLELHDHNFEHISEFDTYWLQPFEQSENPAIADSVYQAGGFRHGRWHKSLSLGDARKRLWIRVMMSNESAENTSFLWSIHDFVDTVALYAKDSKGFVKIDSATYWVIASKRAFFSRPLCIPFSLGVHQKRLFYLCIDQHDNNLYLPMHIRSAVDFMQEQQNFLIDEYWFWLIGFYVFSMVFNLILFSFLRDRIYLWYTLYVMFNATFLLMEDSLDGLFLPQWLYSFIWHAGQYTFLLLSAACGIKIMQLFTVQQKNNPVIHKTGNWLIIFVFLFSLLTFITENYLNHSMRLAFIGKIKTCRDVLILICNFFILMSLIAAFFRRNKLSYYYAVTYFFFFVSCIMFMLNHLGITSINLVKPNILAWGLFFELLTLTILLTGRFKHIIGESEKFKVRTLNLEKDQMRRLLEAQETERQRIAEDLHDDVGATISALQLHISNFHHQLGENEALKKYIEKALMLSGKASADIRSISHDLLPKDFTELGLFRILENRIDELNALQNIRFNFIMHGDDNVINTTYAVMVYRIVNELISNIIKHSQAAHADIQVLINIEDIQLVIEDNGIGIQQAVDRKGIGLRNLKSRVEFLKGFINVDSGLKGTSIIITIPLTNNVSNRK